MWGRTPTSRARPSFNDRSGAIEIKGPSIHGIDREDTKVSASVLFPMGMLSMRVDNTYRYVVPFVTNHVHKLLY